MVPWLVLLLARRPRDTAGYERRVRRLAPLVRLVLSQLVGWDYDGSPAARGCLVSQLLMAGVLPR